MLVRFKADATSGDRGDARRAAKVQRKRGLPGVSGLELAAPAPGVTAAAAAERLERDPDVLYAEPDALRRPSATFPDDDLFVYEWGLHSTGQPVGGSGGAEDADIDAPEAWDVATGAPSVIVAVIDTGVDVAHPDLAPNVRVNGAEVAGNGVDDDGNGFVDDIRGWDFVDGDASTDDPDGHGTHVAGTIAAAGDDGTGVAGVAWRASLLPLRALGPDGGLTSDAIRAYAYAAAAGARVVNLSYGGPARSRAERDALASHGEVLFVAAAGNEGVDNDATPSYPCAYDLDNVVCVAASDRSDGLADFSNRGLRSVDLAAPGVNIASTYPGGRWALLDGTSMASPHVAGAATALSAAEPTATVAALRAALLDGTDRKLSLAGATVTGGRLNLLGSLRALGAAPPPAQPDRRDGSPPPPPPPPQPEPAPAPAPEPAPAPQPEPAPAPTPLAPQPPDLSAPFVTLAAPPSRDLAAFVRRRLLRVSLRCNEPCALRVDLRRGTRVIARGSRTASSTGTTTLRLRLGARERARLRRLRAVRLTLRVRAADPNGNTRTLTRRLTLRRR